MLKFEELHSFLKSSRGLIFNLWWVGIYPLIEKENSFFKPSLIVIERSVIITTNLEFSKWNGIFLMTWSPVLFLTGWFITVIFWCLLKELCLEHSSLNYYILCGVLEFYFAKYWIFELPNTLIDDKEWDEWILEAFIDRFLHKLVLSPVRTIETVK